MYLSFPPLCATRQYDINIHFVGADSSVCTATLYELDGPGIESRWRLDFSYPPDRPWGPLCPLYNAYRFSFPEVNQSGRSFDHPSHLEPELNKDYTSTFTPPQSLLDLF